MKQTISLSLLDNFYPVMCRRVRREKKATNYCTRFGHSLWSARTSCQRNGLKGVESLSFFFFPRKEIFTDTTRRPWGKKRDSVRLLPPKTLRWLSIMCLVGGARWILGILVDQSVLRPFPGEKKLDLTFLTNSLKIKWTKLINF